MHDLIQREIERKARRILEKYRSDQTANKKYSNRFSKRTGLSTSVKVSSVPSHWKYHPHFDPIYCIKHSKFLARTIWHKIRQGEYNPVPAIQFEIPKPDGGMRTIMQFSIPDSAVSNVFHRRLTSRNSGLFSSYSFAYRPDKNIFEAVIHLHRMMQPEKTFILKYDYSKYFDTISHKYLDKFLHDQTFVITARERTAIKAFLSHNFSSYPSWQVKNHIKREIGVPQGSSLSLFLSNIAAHELDMSLERVNGSFVRFADDVIAIAHSYTDARKIELEFRAHCERTGVKINFEKSKRIRLIHGSQRHDARDFFVDIDDGGKIELVEFVDFLGHRVSPDYIDLTDKAVKRIKVKIGRIINLHLIRHARRMPNSPINPNRLGLKHLDWDLVTCINEIRRYIYGGLAEKELINFIEKEVKLRHVRGLLAFYPLVSRIDTLRSLDGWLKSVVSRAIKERNKLIAKSGLPSSLQYSIANDALVDGSWYSADIPLETSLPSFVKGWRAARKFYKRYGLSEIKSPTYYSAMSLYT